MLCGLMLNALVTEVNAGRMPVVGMPSTLHPMNSTWQAATPHTRLAFLGDQAWLGMFSVGDIVLLVGGIFVVAICMRRTLRTTFSPQSVISMLFAPWEISGGTSSNAPDSSQG